MAFTWQRVLENPDLADDWRMWPPEAIAVLNDKLGQALGIDVPKVAEIFQLGLHSAQQQIISEKRRFNVADCGRRFGKSLLGTYLIVETLTEGHPCSWMSPSFRSLGDAWRDLKRILQPITVDKSEQQFRIEVDTGGVLECWSLDNPDAPRGRKYKRVVIDEAAMVRYLGEAWQAVIEPTLLDLLGDAWFLSTPKGSNFFKTIFTWGQDSQRYPEWKSWQMPTTANPTIPHLVEEVEKRRTTLPERIFRQEYLAEFVDDAGGVFRGVGEAAVIDCTEGWPAYAAVPTTNDDGSITLQSREIADDHKYVIGIDWGKLNDFTVLAVIDATTKELVALDRFNQIDYVLQIARLKALARRFNTRTLVPERNSIGEPLIEQLKREDYKVHAFTTTNASKAEVIDALTLAFEKQELHILNLPVLVDELQAYEAERLPSGLLRYSAPEGYHDDCFVKGTQILTNIGQKNIEDVVIGDMVLTRAGYRPVVMTRSTIKHVIDGIGLRGTPDHPIITVDGEKSLQDVGRNDKLHVWNPATSQIERLSFTEARNIIGIRSLSDDNCESTSGDMISGRLRPLRSIVKCGLTLTVQSPPDLSSTTKTTIPSTTTCPTLNCKPEADTPVRTCDSDPLEKWHVRDAQRFSLFSTTPALSFAGTNAGEKRTEQKERVYNLQVADCPEYFANNILVHNCVMALALAWHGASERPRQEPAAHSVSYQEYV